MPQMTPTCIGIIILFRYSLKMLNKIQKSGLLIVEIILFIISIKILNKMKKLLTFSIMLLAGQMAATAQTKLQVIHNCADAAADSVDVYLGSTLLLDNFAFRTATPFIDAPTGLPLTIGVAPKNSTSVADTFFNVTVTLDATKKYIVVANGIESATGYTPGTAAVPFRLSVYDMARQTASTAGNTDILVVHGSTDAPTVDVKAGTSTLVDNIAFGQFCSTGYLSVPESDVVLDVTTSDGATIVKRYSAPLATLNLGDSAITVLASGFLDSTVNSNGKSFGLWVALAKGEGLIPLPSLALPTSVNNVAASNNIKVYPNPAYNVVTVDADGELDKVTLLDVTGRVLQTITSVKKATLDISNLSAGIYIVATESAVGGKNSFMISKK